MRSVIETLTLWKLTSSGANPKCPGIGRGGSSTTMKPSALAARPGITMARKTATMISAWRACPSLFRSLLLMSNLPSFMTR